jgi:hypothetical protein
MQKLQRKIPVEKILAKKSTSKEEYRQKIPTENVGIEGEKQCWNRRR